VTLLHRLASMLRWIFRRDRVEQALDDELRGYVEMAARARMRDGVSPDEARRQAMLELGGLEQAKEQVRSRRHGAWLDETARDVRYALRMFVRTPGFTFVVVLTLALGIGANTAIFGLIDALMLRSLPVPHPQELLQVRMRAPGSTGPAGESFSYVMVGALAQQRDIFRSAAGFSTFNFDVGPSGSLTRVSGALVTGGYYETLGLTPAAGRLLAPPDDEPGAPLAAVISYGYWQRQLAGSVGAIGQTLRINGVPVTIVGVSPRGFEGATVGSIADITLTAATLPQVVPSAAPLLGPGNFWLRALARPAPGVSPAQATARLNAVWPQFADSVIAAHWPASRRQAVASMVYELGSGSTGWTYLREVYRKPLYVLMGVVGLVLLIACANVASLLLARASARQRELAVRLAIGASRGRIVRQLLIESLLLSAVGAAFGVVMATFLGQLLVAMLSGGPMPLEFDLSPNWNVLGFTTAIAIATGMLFGVAPALQATSAVSPSSTLQSGARVARPRSRLLRTLVSTQVALSLVVLAGAGLFVRTLQNLQQLDPGFSTEGVLIVEVDSQSPALLQELVETVQGMPNVLSASLTTHTPLNGSLWSEPFVRAGEPLPERDTTIVVGAGPGFFETMETRLVSGRDFSERDTAGSQPVVVVNEAFAQKYFAGVNPIGQRLSAGVRGKPREVEIVGLVRNTNNVALRLAPSAIVYLPLRQLETGFRTTSLVARVRGSVAADAASIRQVLQAKLPDTVLEVQPMSAQVASTIVQERMLATLAGGFGVLALLLACIGLYGLLAYNVTQRIKEIGIRMALGSTRRSVVTLVLGGGVRLVLAGIVVGLPAAWAASRWVESLLFGVTRMDPLTVLGAIALLVASAQLAAYVPARRASHVDPLVALRHE
jgi:putative ABC transport system permease protein